MTKKISLILVLLTLVQVFAGCAEGGADDESVSADTNAAGAQAQTELDRAAEETELTKQNVPDNLPKTMDFQDVDINVVYVDSAKHQRELYVEEDTGDALDSAIFTRNLNVEERLKVNIVPIAGNPASDAKMAVNAGIDDYQVVAGQQYQMMQQATSKLYFNFNELEYIDTDQPWWAQKFIESATIGNEQLYYLTGDATMTMLMNMGVIYVNNTLFENMYGSVSDLYDVVLAGDWNFDLMQSYIEGMYIDINGNSQRDVDDLYGFSSTTLSMLDYIVGGADLRFCEFDESGYPTLVINNERSINFAEELYSLMYENPGTYITAGSVEGENTIIKKFSEDSLMFLPFRAETSEQFRDMESDYAILPCPKFDDTQNGYSTAVHDSATVLAVPITNVERNSATCAFLEAFAAESYRTVTDVYFGTLLKEKFARDENVATIFDIILDGVYFDFALLHSYALNSVGQLFRTVISNGNANFASEYQRNAKVYDKKMSLLIEAYKKEN